MSRFSEAGKDKQGKEKGRDQIFRSGEEERRVRIMGQGPPVGGKA